MIPTATRNNPSIFLAYKEEGIMIDCGENTQRQLRIAKIPPPKITRLLITHWHGDHIFGLPGFLQTLGTSNYKKTLRVYGPKGLKKNFSDMLACLPIRAKNILDIKVSEIEKEGLFTEEEGFSISAYRLRHPAPCLGYIFKEADTRKINIEYTKRFGLVKHPLLGKLQRGQPISYKGEIITVEKGTYLKPGKKIGILLDTSLCDSCYKVAHGADLLISEATHLHELEEKATRYKHLTAKQAAEIAKKAGAKKLVLTHFSQRYEKNITAIEKEASSIFPGTICAKDFMKVEV